MGLGRAGGAGTGRALWTVRAGGAWKIGGTGRVGGAGGLVGSQLTLLGLWQALKALQEMSSATPATPLQPLSRKAKSIPVQTFEVSPALPPALLSFGVLWGFQHQLGTSGVTLRAQTPRCFWGRPDARQGAGGVPCVLPHPSVPWQVKLDITLGDLTKIGKSQKYTLSVDVEGGKLVVLKKQKDSQEDWNTFTHDKSEWGGVWGAPAPVGLPLHWGASL